MIENVKSPPAHLYARRCVCCGHDTPTFRESTAPACESCGCDFLERPPRSYAEMEGLIWQRRPMPKPIRESIFAPERVMRRWLILMFLFTFGLISIILLAAAMTI